MRNNSKLANQSAIEYLVYSLSVSSLSEGVEIENSDRFVTCCKAMLQRLREVSPQQDIDGTDNIWIIKPAAKSRGRGEKFDTVKLFT